MDFLLFALQWIKHCLCTDLTSVRPSSRWPMFFCLAPPALPFEFCWLLPCATRCPLFISSSFCPPLPRWRGRARKAAYWLTDAAMWCFTVQNRPARRRLSVRGGLGGFRGVGGKERLICCCGVRRGWRPPFNLPPAVLGGGGGGEGWSVRAVWRWCVIVWFHTFLPWQTGAKEPLVPLCLGGPVGWWWWGGGWPPLATQCLSTDAFWWWEWCCRSLGPGKETHGVSGNSLPGAAPFWRRKEKFADAGQEVKKKKRGRRSSGGITRGKFWQRVTACSGGLTVRLTDSHCVRRRLFFAEPVHLKWLWF